MRLSDVRVLMNSTLTRSEDVSEELKASGLSLQDNMRGVMEVLQTTVKMAGAQSGGGQWHHYRRRRSSSCACQTARSMTRPLTACLDC